MASVVTIVTGWKASLREKLFLKSTIGLCAGLLLTLATSVVNASEHALSVPGLPGVEAYPNATLRSSDEREAGNYPIMASRISKVRGDIRAESQQWLNGDLARAIYEIPRGHSSEKAFDWFRRQLEEQGVKLTFTCSSRNCGRSNLWANDIFGESILYGMDREQYYYLGSRSEGKKTEYFTLYSIGRGTHRVYVMLDRLTVSTP